MNSIKIKHIPGLFPAVDYEDIIYNIFSFSKLPESRLKVIETEAELATLHEPDIYTNRTIQAQKYDRFEIKILTNSLSNLELLRLSGQIEVDYEGFEKFNAKCTDIKFDKIIDGLLMYRATIQLFKIDLAYHSIFNYLSFPECARGIDVDQLYCLTFYCNKLNVENCTEANPAKFYTILKPKFSISDPDLKETDRTGEKMTNQSITFDVVTLQLYVSESDANFIKKYLPRCCYSNSLTDFGLTRIISGQAAYTSIERVIPKIQAVKDAIDLFEVEVELKYSKLVFNNYRDVL